MRLSALLDAGVSVQGAAGDVEITGLALDSRRIRPGELFAALPGSRLDGRRYVADALARGAAAVLADPSLAGTDLGVPLVVDPNPRRRLALIAARWYGRQPRTVVAVTGTNGKTSVASFVCQIWRALGTPAAALGTLGLDAPGGRREVGLTTPDPLQLHAALAELAAAGVEHLALEASSHGLAQHRLDGVVLRAAAFTNLSRDHYDYHGSVAAYLAAKRRLFSDLLPPEGTAVLNADQPHFAMLAAVCRERGIAVLDYGRQARRLRLETLSPHAGGLGVTFALDGRERRLDVDLIGGFQAENVLAALGLLIATGIEPDPAIEAMAQLKGAPGRLERVAVHPSGAPVFVDYAHTPDALAQVLAAVRPHASGRLVVVFGCGGDRDPGKRPEMGRVASEHADRVFVTDDNPRSEDPAAIRAAILAAAPGAVEIGDRAEAIRAALAGLTTGDLLVVAGKGHETGQIVGDRVLPFDDRAVVRAALADLTGAAA